VCHNRHTVKLVSIKNLMKKRSEATQTLRAGCSKAEPKHFAPPQTPFPGERDGQNLISWRWSLPTFTHKPSFVSTQFRVIVVTDPQTPKHTNTQTDSDDYNTLRLRRS